MAIALLALALAPPALTVRVDRKTIVEKIQATFKGVQVFVGEDRVDPKGKPIPGSAIVFGPALGNKRVEFSVPAQTRDLGWLGQIKYVPNGISVRDYSVRATEREYEVTLYFASSGPALKGSHSWLGDAGAPDIDLKAAHVIVRMRPSVAEETRIYFQNPEVAFWADVQTQGLTWNVMGRKVDLLDSVTGYRDQIKEAIEAQLAHALAGPNARTLLSQKVQEFLQQQAARFGAKVSRIQLDGTELVLTLRRA